MNKSFLIAIILIATINGCASTPQIVIDPRSIESEAKYQKDLNECFAISRSYDLSESASRNAVVGATAGGVAVAGVATAIAGAVFLPAVPFIVAGATAGGLAGGGLTKSGETASREKILAECMTDRGYKAYRPN